MKLVFVHRYKWTHADMRKKYRRMCKDGLVTLLEESPAGFLYKHKPATDNQGQSK